MPWGMQVQVPRSECYRETGNLDSLCETPYFVLFGRRGLTKYTLLFKPNALSLAWGKVISGLRLESEEGVVNSHFSGWQHVHGGAAGSDPGPG